MKLPTLSRLARPRGEQEVPESDSPAEVRPGGVRDTARRAAEAVRQDPRVQDAAAGLRGRVQEWRDVARARADRGLERLIEEAHTGRGGEVPGEVAALLARRRQEREARAARLRARRDLLALAESPAQRRVLALVARATPWAGGEEPEVRYTTVLDRLAPSGDPAGEMEVHRALWTLAERRVLAVSPHGAVTASPLPEQPL